MAVKRTSKLHAYLAEQYAEFGSDSLQPRLSSLFSDFSKLAMLNKYGYDANIGYWRSVILDCNRQGYLGSTDHAIVIDAASLSETFQRPGMGRPLALGHVVSSMEADGDLVALSSFDKVHANSSSWLSWMMGNVIPQRRPGSSDPATHGLYIVMPTLKDIAKRIVKDHYQRPLKSALDHLVTFEDIRTRYQKCDSLELTDSDLILVLKYLHHSMGLAMADDVKGYEKSYLVVKFPESNTGSAQAEITQHDKAIISIKTTCQALEVQVDDLQRKIEELERAAKDFYVKKQKTRALYCLKRKKHLDEILERRLTSLETMETMLMKIEASHNDLQIVKAFNIGADALRGIMSNSELTLESVDEAMVKMQDALDDQREVEDAIATRTEETNAMQLSGIDDAELEKELEALEHLEVKAPEEKAHQKEKEEIPREQILENPQTKDTPPVKVSAQKLPVKQGNLSDPYPQNEPVQDKPHLSPTDSELARLGQVLASLDKPRSPAKEKPMSYEYA
ncbi:Snf7-domain-containing protein [Phycomyces nitens]|nr:Snf7-domain-containing protein [Phycomyces nitens]